MKMRKIIVLCLIILIFGILIGLVIGFEDGYRLGHQQKCVFSKNRLPDYVPQNFSINFSQNET